MRKAFTLIELLVVIAIIAILAAILFPVFAQAKASAKKSTAISNQKQIGLAIIQYCADNDDVYPRNDDCVLNSSLNSAKNNQPPGTDPQLFCQYSGYNFAFRMNHFSWQKWVLPYMKNVEIFFHPGKGKIDAVDSNGKRQWSDHGQIAGSFAINTALTGALNTGDIPMATRRVFRNSYIGGVQSNIPNVAATALVLESINPTSGLWPASIRNSEFNNYTVTYYPFAIRETLVNDLYNKAARGLPCDGVPVGEPSNPLVFGGGITVSFADGSAKFIQTGKLIALTPTIAEYSPGTTQSCYVAGSNARIGDTVNLNINYPFWGLGQ